MNKGRVTRDGIYKRALMIVKKSPSIFLFYIIFKSRPVIPIHAHSEPKHVAAAFVKYDRFGTVHAG